MADQRLADLASHGDREAFITLYRRYVDRVYRYVRWKSGSAGAEDAVSEIFLRAFRGMPRFRQGGSFAAWMFGIARNVLRESARSRRPDEPLEAAANRSDPGDEPGRLLLDQERLDLARRLVSSLVGFQREVIELRYWGSLPFSEIATITGRSEGAVRVMAHRALRTIRERIGEDKSR